MHRDCQSQPKLLWIWFRQSREQAETLPLTIITCQFLWPWSEIPKTHSGWHDDNEQSVH